MHVAADPDLDALLRALTRWKGGRALVPLSELPGLWGMGPDEATDLAAELEDSGHLSTWADGLSEPAVILTSLSAGRLGVELIPSDAADLLACRWQARGRSARP